MSPAKKSRAPASPLNPVTRRIWSDFIGSPAAPASPLRRRRRGAGRCWMVLWRPCWPHETEGSLHGSPHHEREAPGSVRLSPQDATEARPRGVGIGGLVGLDDGLERAPFVRHVAIDPKA